MIELFSLEGIQKKPAVFDTAKLEWMNGQYLSMRPAEELLVPVTGHLGGDGRRSPTAATSLPLIDSVKARSRTLLDIAQQVAVRLPGGPYVRDPKAEEARREARPRVRRQPQAGQGGAVGPAGRAVDGGAIAGRGEGSRRVERQEAGRHPAAGTRGADGGDGLGAGE